MKILEVENINKYFYDPIRFKVLEDISFSVEKGKLMSMIGKSGSGKSTLLYILSTMDTDYQGKLWIDQELVTGKKNDALAEIRNNKIGFVFQFHYLLQEFSCLKNIMIPALKLGIASKEAIEDKAMKIMEILDIKEQALKPANKLSGGQQQRVAIARALINDPAIIMCDEPTGNLDSKNTAIILDIFKNLTKEMKQTIITVTHDESFALQSDEVIELKDGHLI
ncbi:MAG: ABC transporter ATP-binding protein [Chitinophagales bacterium]|nr:ABC transporter ATP-binding protein [Chitinophagales bacterium]